MCSTDIDRRNSSIWYGLHSPCDWLLLFALTTIL